MQLRLLIFQSFWRERLCVDLVGPVFVLPVVMSQPDVEVLVNPYIHYLNTHTENIEPLFLGAQFLEMY